jgi:nucleoside-diphosphate-sugar epimerase
LANYLITGVAGFIGSHLAHALVAQGHAVRGLDNLSSGLRGNIALGVDFHEIDLRDATATAEACKGIDVILHQAALPSVPRSVLDPRTSHECNINGTFNLLEGARAAGVKRVVYAASSSAYGNQPGFPRVETMAPQPISPYAVQKLTGELYMQSYWQVYGIETVCLRYFNIFGSRQVPDSPYSGVMARFIMEMLDGKTPTIFGDGEQGRDFTHVDNAVQANLLAATAPAAACAGRVFNVACGERHTLNETYTALADLLEFPHAANYGPTRAGDVRDSLADITQARQYLGYNPNVSFLDGLASTIDWYRANLPIAKAGK